MAVCIFKTITNSVNTHTEKQTTMTSKNLYPEVRSNRRVTWRHCIPFL